jgi:hypothetical protein
MRASCAAGRVREGQLVEVLGSVSSPASSITTGRSGVNNVALGTPAVRPTELGPDAA